MDLSKYLQEAMGSHVVFTIPFPFKTDGILKDGIPIYDSIITMWIVMAVLIILALIFTRNLKKIPEGKQNAAEILVNFINSFTKDNLGHHWKHFAPYLGTVLLFLVISNIISIFSIIPSFEQLAKLTHLGFFENLKEFSYEIKPPTKDINVTVCMALMSIILVIGSGIRFKGMKGWLKSFVKPIPVMLPFNILDYFIRPLSLSLRLFGNILGAFIIMELIYIAAGAVIPAAFSIYFDLFDGALQAYIFVFLTSIYIAEAIE